MPISYDCCYHGREWLLLAASARWRSPLEGGNTAGSSMPDILNLEPFSPISHLWLIQTSCWSISALMAALFQCSSCFLWHWALVRGPARVSERSWAISSILPEGFLGAFCKLILLLRKVLLLRALSGFAPSNKNPVTSFLRGWTDSLHNWEG